MLILRCLILFTSVPFLLSAQLNITDMTCEYLKNPIGIDVQDPRLSWKIKTAANERDILQTAYQIQASHSADFHLSQLSWDSGKRVTNQSVHIEYQGAPLKSRAHVYWRVKIWDNQGRVTDWSPLAFFEMGLLNANDWQATWIESTSEANIPLLRKSFRLNRKIKEAKLYITAHGLYDVKINGNIVSQDLFTPGWTSYKKRLQYQAYDVTTLLRKGKNVIGVRLAEGWYGGTIGWEKQKGQYGDQLALLCQLEIEYTNGDKEIIATDSSWKSGVGAIINSGIYKGETYDARLEQRGWTTVKFDDANWTNVKVADHPKNVLVGTLGNPVQVIDTLKVLEKIITPKGETILDMGQNMVGRICFQLKGKRGDTITLYHAEVLDKEGNFYTDNLRQAGQKIQYVFRGNGVESYEPTFTFQGFRYVKIADYEHEISLNDFQGLVIHSDMELTGTFECSNPKVNQLQSNIRWSQKGNFLDIPTDCPQRDERMGWTGDVQVFAPTACFNYNAAAFYSKWLRDLNVDQLSNGAVPWVIPNVLSGSGSTGWGDVATILPWTLYLKYGDVRILEEQYPSMQAWVNFLDQLAGENHLVQDGFHFGDWLFFIHPSDWNTKPGYTDVDLIATAFFVHSTQLLINAAEVLERKEDLRKYRELNQQIKKAFQEEFMTKTGRLSSHTQTAYTLALAFNLIPEEYKKSAVKRLVQNIKTRNYRLSTGFLGTPYLNHVLSDHGYLDVAYMLLTQEAFPSWLYPITKGATTIWERWDGIKPDGTFQNDFMNSFNHYAYGAIGDWMYTAITGIKHDPNYPGFQHFLIQPQPHKSLTHAKASYQSPYGVIRSSWKIINKEILIKFTIPPNTTATVTLPNYKEVLELGSGDYEYQYEFNYIN